MGVSESPPTPEQIADELAQIHGLHCGDFPHLWAKTFHVAIAAAIRDAVLAERKECALTAGRAVGWCLDGRTSAAAIEARGKE